MRLSWYMVRVWSLITYSPWMQMKSTHAAKKANTDSLASWVPKPCASDGPNIRVQSVQYTKCRASATADCASCHGGGGCTSSTFPAPPERPKLLHCRLSLSCL